MKHFSIHFTTWNVGLQNEINGINCVIENSVRNNFSILVFSLQEIDDSSKIKDDQVLDSFKFWTDALQNQLQSNYELKFAENWANSALFIFVSKLQEFSVEYEYLKSCHILHPRANNMPLSKASIISFQRMNGLNFAIIGSHLECYDENYAARNSEWLEVLKIASELSPDYIFLLGDLNYRIELPRSEVLVRIQNQDYKYLLEHDQLNRGKRENSELHIFKEAEITFQPTYKYERNSTNYDQSRPIVIEKNSFIYRSYFICHF